LALEVAFYGYLAIFIFLGIKKSNTGDSLFIAGATLTFLSVVAPSINNAFLNLISLGQFGSHFALGLSIGAIANKSKNAWKIIFSINVILVLDKISSRLMGSNLELHYFAHLAAFALLVLICVFSWTPSPKILKNQSVSRFLRVLALMTYPIYLSHEFLGMAAISVFTLNGIPAPVAILIMLLFLFIFSWVVTRFIEPYLQATLSKGLGW
jgi:peptidoglycan/LPS O-acetylase OafA/YrhL